MDENNRRGLLLINLGTPDSPTAPDVRRYLDEFLMDPYVIDINPVARFLLVKGIILNTRPKKSAAAYQKIWTPRGSPLLYHSEDLVQKLRALLPGTRVELGMRYGQPSLEFALQKLHAQGVKSLSVLPLYPQYSLAATESSVQKVKDLLPNFSFTQVDFIPDFFAHPAFIGAFADIARESLEDFAYDYLLMSFHGVPERHVKKTDPSGQHCLAKANCCDEVREVNRQCYRAQCFATARALAKNLELKANHWSVSFQSRLGRTPWIQPFTDEVLPRLAAQGVKRVAVMCPAFTADCLETLEEIQIRAREDFIRDGGEDLRLVPSLNSHDRWVQAVAQIAKDSPENPH